MFFDLQHVKLGAVAAIQDKRLVTYGELKKQCALFSKVLEEASLQKIPLVFLKVQNDIDTLIAYISLLQRGFPTLLLDPELEVEKLDRLIAIYQPNLLIEGRKITQVDSRQHQISADLALLLSTSGSTGSAKQVCLSAENLHANAQSICDYLPIQGSDKTITTLPFFYSYGLSVINSHLLEGACIVFNQESVVSRGFWQCFDEHQINSLAGVPHSYEMLLRLRFTNREMPSLRYFTQAGGKLASSNVETLASFADKNNKQFFIMYGQTEATARMSYLSAEKALAKPDSIGQAIPQGVFYLQDEAGENIDTPHKTGELIYIGPNIMLGYANSVADLSGFHRIDMLATGDMAYFDEQGDYFISGRKKRFIKLFGQRINLDEVEQLLMQKELETYCCGDDTKLIVAVKNNNEIKVLTKTISELLKLHHSMIQVLAVEQLPLTANGKKDYQQVMNWVNTP